MKRFFLVALLASIALVSQAQTEQERVSGVINQLFKGMYLADSTMVLATLQPDVTMATVFTTKDGKPGLSRKGTAADFAKSVGTPHPEPYSEEIWNLTVQVDGNFAQAWCDYAFYVGNTFSHCGVDAFQLFKTADGWKIFHLADTRRKTDCNIPATIEAKHKK